MTRIIALAAIGFAGHGSAAGVLSDYLNFAGPLPSGWTAYLNPQASGTGFEYTSGKFEVDTYNTGAFLEKSFDPDNRLEFIDVTYSTLATQSTFLSGVANYLYNARGQQIAALGVGSTTDRNFQTRILTSRDTGIWYSDAVLGPVNGEVLVHERFSDGLEQIVAALASDPSVYQRLDLLLPGFAVRDVAKFQMYAGTTTGNPVWIDDLSVTSGESSVISRALKATASSLSDLFSETAKLLAIESTYLSYLSHLTSADVKLSTTSNIS